MTSGGRQHQRGQRMPLRVSLTLAAALSAFGASYFLTRRLRRRKTQSEALREGPTHLLNAENLGKYICVKGKVDCLEGEVGGEALLTSPLSGVKCVMYEKITYKLVENRTERTTAGTVHQPFSVGSILKNSGAGCLSAMKLKRREETTVGWVEISRLEASSTNICIRNDEGTLIYVDLSGAEFFALEAISETLDAAGNIKVVEKVLQPGVDLVLCGELQLHGSAYAMQRSRPRSMLDLKTSSIDRPFLASLKSVEAVLHDVERGGRFFLWGASGSFIIGLYKSWETSKLLLSL
jgi:hypothetical protein